MAAGLQGLLLQAKRAARRRTQRVSTAHLLLCMLQDGGQAAAALAARGVRETELLRALKLVDEEPHSGVEMALERAHKIAVSLKEPQARPIHLLLAIVREPRSAAHRCLNQIGIGAPAVRDEVLSILDARPAGMRTTERAGAMASHRSRLSPSPGLRQIPTRSRAWRATDSRLEAEAVTSRACEPASLEPQPELRTASGTKRSASSAKRGHTKAGAGNRRREKEKATEPRAPWFELDSKRYPLLSTTARNLTAQAAEDRVDPVVGRDGELERILDILARRRANNPVLVGPPGVGKTAMVEGLARALYRGEKGTAGLQGRIVLELSAGGLIAGTGVRGALADKLRALRKEVARSEGRILLFLDEIHALVGAGEGADDVANELKASLARGELPCIGATTDTEYRKIFERDAALARRFTRVQIDEPTAEDARVVVRGVALQYERHHGVAYEPEALDAAVEMSVRYLTERQLPDKAIGLIDQAAARARRMGEEVVGVEAVARVVAEQAKVPLERLLMRDHDRLLRLETELAQRVLGQDDAVRRIAAVLRKSAAGFRGQRPLGTFLFLGPTGVGKTEMAKAISDVVFLTSEITRIDMSELSEPHSVARLFGAPPGYLGHDDGGQLTEPVRRAPYQMVLLDEIEKAHPEVRLALLSVLDEGRATDGRGRSVDFTNTIVVMTSNLGGQVQVEAPRIGFGEGRDERHVRDREELALAAARSAIAPELWNRIDEPLFFRPLQRADIGAIAMRLLRHVAEVLMQEHRVAMEVDPSAVDALVEAGGYDAALGARPMRRAVSRLVEAPLAELVLSGELRAGDEVVVWGNDAVVEVVPRPVAAE